MLFGGLQKCSLIDYPGKVSSVLFLSGCTFHCPYCHNPELVKGHSPYSSVFYEKSVFDFLKGRIGLLDGVVISGGEPTLHAGLPSFCERIKHMGFSVKLDTNGSRPAVIKELIDQGFIDYIAMDIKTDPFHYFPQISKDYDPRHIIASIETIMESPVDYEFRTTCVKSIVDPRMVSKIAKIIKGGRLYALQAFHHSKVLRPEFFRKTEAAFNEEELMHLKSIAGPWVTKCIIR
jgi:pyruvate formate lyase activating enzyme